MVTKFIIRINYRVCYEIEKDVGRTFDTLKCHQKRFRKCYKKITTLKYKLVLIFKGMSNILSIQESIFRLYQIECVCRKDEIEWVYLKKKALFSRLSQTGTNTANCSTFQILWSATHRSLTRIFWLLLVVKCKHGGEKVGHVCRKDMSEGQKCNMKFEIWNSRYKHMKLLVKICALLVITKKLLFLHKDMEKSRIEYHVLPT